MAPQASCNRLVQATFAAFALLFALSSAQNDGTHFLDRFNYDKTVDRGDGFYDYGPKDWNDIKCDERTSESLDECIAYPSKWHEGRNWSIQKNYCRWCVPGNEDVCGRHHQSPINLLRDFGLDPATNPNATECIDLHWMKYEDSTCDLQDLIDHNAFTIERHALRISQPIKVYENIEDDTDGMMDGVELLCHKSGIGNAFGRIDFSKGFHDWWFLSHFDVHVPSEHTQEGKQYDAEIQMYHFYSIPYPNEMAAVSVFLQAYEDAAPYHYLDKVICEWRRAEYETRLTCGLDPVESSYPGCFPLTRNRNLREGAAGARATSGSAWAAAVRYLKEELFSNMNAKVDERLAKKNKKFQTVADVIYYNDAISDKPAISKVDIAIDDINYAPAKEKDWESWIHEQDHKMKQDEALYHKLKKTEFGGKHTEDLHEKYRRLIQGDELEWFNYWPLIGVRTEYYYRYRGTQTIPPCYGQVETGTVRGTNHWRVMKDPIRIHPRQLEELNRLIRERIAPVDDPVNACNTDTAAKVSEDGKVNTARPIMYTQDAHATSFCECIDWPSKWPDDRAWCLEKDNITRLFDKPYNFATDGF